MEGWVKLHRKMREWQHYKEPSVVLVFLDLLLSANSKTTDGEQLGQTTISIDSICENTGLSRNTVRTAIKKLVETGEIERVQMKNSVLTTIKNFDKYQGPRRGSKNDPKGGQKLTPLNSKGGQKLTISGSKIAPPPPFNSIRIEEYNRDETRARAHETNASILTEFFSRQTQVENFCKNNGVTTELLRQMAEEVINDWELAGTTHHDRDDMMRHLISTLRIKCRDRRNNGTDNYQKSNGDSRQAEREQLARGVAAVISRRLAKDKPHPSEVRQP